MEQSKKREKKKGTQSRREEEKGKKRGKHAVNLPSAIKFPFRDPIEWEEEKKERQKKSGNGWGKGEGEKRKKKGQVKIHRFFNSGGEGKRNPKGSLWQKKGKRRKEKEGDT